jgi:RNA polymerase sigma-70 factor (ECF subfamily)
MSESVKNKDLALMQRVKKEDISALEEINKAYWKPLVVHAMSVLRCGHPASDIVQECLSNFWERRASHKETLEIEPYLHQAVRYSCIDWKKKNHNSRTHESQFAELKDQFSFHDPAENTELKSALEAAMKTLPAQLYKVFKGIYVDGMGIKELSLLLKLGPQTVRGYHTEATKLMRKKLKGFLK